MACFVIDALEGSTKRPFAQKFQNFVSITNMVIFNIFVVAAFIVIPKIKLEMRRPLNFLN